MGCTTTLIKYLVFIFNTLCALLGIATIVVSSLALKNTPDEGRFVCIFLIVLGSVIFLISFFGCCGAIRENACFLWTYAVFLLILIVANGVILGFCGGKLNGEKHARKSIEGAWNKTLNNNTESMAFYEKTFECCGKNSPQDYSVINKPIPTSCYANGNSSNATNLYNVGCLQKVTEVYESSEYLVNIFSWASLGVECVALICAFILANHYRNEHRRATY